MINCYLCEKKYTQNDLFYLYLCYDCHNKTSFCLNCDKIMMKIFENNNMFKCGNCRKIVPAITKELIEVTNPIDNNPNLNLSAINENLISPKKILNNNKNYNNEIIFNNNSNLFSPSDSKLLNQLVGNKIAINSPSLNSPFFKHKNNFQRFQESPNLNNNNLENQQRIKDINNNNENNNTNNNENYIHNSSNNNNFDEQNSISCFSDNNTAAKKKNSFILITNNNGKKIIKNKQNLFQYFDLNNSKNFDEEKSFNKVNKNDLSGYFKKIKETKIDDGYFKYKK